MVTVFEHKYSHSIVQLGNRNVEFLDHTFITEDEELANEIKESKSFKNGKIIVLQEVKSRQELEDQKKEQQKRRGRPRVISGSKGTNN